MSGICWYSRKWSKIDFWTWESDSKVTTYYNESVKLWKAQICSNRMKVILLSIFVVHFSLLRSVAYTYGTYRSVPYNLSILFDSVTQKKVQENFTVLVPCTGKRTLQHLWKYDRSIDTILQYSLKVRYCNFR